MTPSILVVDDHEGVRQGLRRLLNASRPEWNVCGEASSGEEAIAVIATLNPDIVILDVSMAGISGIETVKRIRQSGTKPPIVMFTMHDSEELAQQAYSAGADGYVRKSQAGRDLVTAIDSILSGGTFFPSNVRNTP